MKIKAFTLMELTVVMVVASILLTIIFKGLNLINSYYFLEKERAQKEIVNKQWITTFEKDVLETRKLAVEKNRLILNGLERKVSYVFSKDKIVRHFNNGEYTFSIEGLGFRVLGDSIIRLTQEDNSLDYFVISDLSKKINNKWNHE